MTAMPSLSREFTSIPTLGRGLPESEKAFPDIGLCQIFLRELVLALPGRTMHSRNPIRYRIAG
jgi:hypothetical protein